MDMTNPPELRATVHAMLGDVDGFTQTASPILAHMENIKLELEARKQTVTPELTPDFAAYFDAVRARFLSA